jgi:CRISPR system Cascade subunit CasA
VEPFCCWFVLDHQQYPFMQTRRVKAKEITPIQKFFIGLPEGNNHALFNDKGEIDAVCASCSAIALFNQASNCPSFGGGFKANLRGSAPNTTFAAGDHLRETLWFNVLSQDRIADLST